MHSTLSVAGLIAVAPPRPPAPAGPEPVVDRAGRPSPSESTVRIGGEEQYGLRPGALPGTYDRWGQAVPLEPPEPAAAPLPETTEPTAADGMDGATGDPRAQGPEGTDPAGAEKPEPAPTSETRSEPAEGLTEDEKRIVAELRSIDARVRAHERAHSGAGGSLAGAPSYSYQTGPDGRRYAVGGEVAISMPSGGDPAQRLRDARQVRQAALAPANPSPADRAVASMASRAQAQALAALAEERSIQASEEGGDPEPRPTGRAGTEEAAP